MVQIRTVIRYCQFGTAIVIRYCQFGTDTVLRSCQFGIATVLRYCQFGTAIVLRYCQFGTDTVLRYCQLGTAIILRSCQCDTAIHVVLIHCQYIHTNNLGRTNVTELIWNCDTWMEINLNQWCCCCFFLLLLVFLSFTLRVCQIIMWHLRSIRCHRQSFRTYCVIVLDISVFVKREYTSCIKIGKTHKMLYTCSAFKLHCI